jgi:hypothetical protein
VSVGGDDHNKMTAQVMSALLSKDVSLLYSMQGRKGKKSFMPLTLYKCVVGERHSLNISEAVCITFF